MGNVHKLTQHYLGVTGDMSTELGAEANDFIQSANFFDMANFDLVSGVGQMSSVASDSTITLQMYEATDNTGGASQTVAGATDTYVSVNAASLDLLSAQVRGEDLSAGFQFVGVRVTTDLTNGSEVASIWLLGGRARYKQATLVQ